MRRLSAHMGKWASFRSPGRADTPGLAAKRGSWPFRPHGSRSYIGVRGQLWSGLIQHA